MCFACAARKEAEHVVDIYAQSDYMGAKNQEERNMYEQMLSQQAAIASALTGVTGGLPGP